MYCNLQRLPIELLLLALARLTNAVALSDFTPKSSGLTPQCEAVYTQAIPGCSASDFSSLSAPNAACSSSCIAGMFSMSNAVFNACGGNPVNNQNIIEQFIVGSGVQDLCSNAKISTLSAGGVFGTSLVATSLVTASTQAPPAPPPVPPSTNLPQPSTTPIPQPITSVSVSLSTPTATASSQSVSPTTTSSYVPPPVVFSGTSTLSSFVSSSSSTSTSSSSLSSLYSDTSSGSSVTTTVPLTPQTSPTPSATSIPYNNPPAALTGASSLSFLTSQTGVGSGTGSAAAAQTSGCVPNGGGGSIIGGRECPASGASGSLISAVNEAGWWWTLLALVVVGVVFLGL